MRILPSVFARKNWICTFSGSRYYPADPLAAEVKIVDIAHALAYQCRYTGHSKKFYCPTPEQHILTADLRWVPAGDLVVGDELLAFDEHAVTLGQSGRPRRRFKHAQVLETIPVRRHVWRLEFSDGSFVRASDEHPWLIATKMAGNQKWQSTRDIAAAVKNKQRRLMNRFAPVWKYEGARDAGYLAGLYDGEGYFSSVGRSGVQMGIAQNPGGILDEIRGLHAKFGYVCGETPVGRSNVINLQVLGGWREYARLLGSIRPMRLLNKFVTILRSGSFGKQLQGAKDERLEIVRVWDEGETWVSGIETSARTYLCEGFAAHNSVGEHSVLVSEVVSPNHALVALMHDAPEAYIHDISGPLKRHLPDYRAIEAWNWVAIANKFRLPIVMPAEVKVADTAVLLAEMRVLLPPMPGDHGIRGKPADVQIMCLPPEEAESLFLHRFYELTKGMKL